MDYLPIFQKIDDNHKILLIGGGNVATAKFEAIKPYSHAIKVKSKNILPHLEKTLIEENITYEIGEYNSNDLNDISIVIAATNNREVNRTIKKEANEKGILVNCVDDKDLCDFIFPALVRRGSLQIAISSSGISPVITRLVKRSIEMILPEGLERVMDFLKDKRKIVMDKLKKLQPRRLFWEKFLTSDAINNILEGDLQKSNTLFDEMLNNIENTNNAALYLIGTGCGDPDLITLKGAYLLSRADIILYDRLISKSLLDRFGRKDAVKIAVGKKRGVHTLKQKDIDVLIKEYLSQGKIVARLKGGDPSIFAHSAEEIKIAKDKNASWQVVPGITAALGCAAYAGFPLTERKLVKSVKLMTLYEKDIYDDNVWKNLAKTDGETLVFYMSIHHNEILCQKLIHFGMKPSTPIVAIEQGTTPQHREYYGTLETFVDKYSDTEFISPTLFIIGETVRMSNNTKPLELNNEQKRYF